MVSPARTTELGPGEERRAQVLPWVEEDPQG